MQNDDVITNSRWRTDAILKIVISLSSWYCPIKAKFGGWKQNRVQKDVTWPKWPILQIQDGGRPPFWKWLYIHFSAANYPDFGEIWRAGTKWVSDKSHIKKTQNFANSKWQPAAVLKIIFGYISAVYCLINAKLDM